MNSLKRNQEGLIPMLIMLFLLMIGIIFLVYMRVQNAN